MTFVEDSWFWEKKTEVATLGSVQDEPSSPVISMWIGLYSFLVICYVKIYATCVF